MHDVVVSAVRKAVSAATIIFTAISISRFFAILHFSFFIEHRLWRSFLIPHSSFKELPFAGHTLCLVLVGLTFLAATVVTTASGVAARVRTSVTRVSVTRGLVLWIFHLARG